MNRKYTDAELREILAKAVAEGDSTSLQEIEGVSLAEIKEIGAEVGIDPGSLERAARSVDSSDGGYRAALAGAPVSTSATRRVEGTLGPVPTSELLRVIRHGMGRPGEIADVKGLLEWRSSGELGERVITLESKGGVTTVSGMADLTQAAVITHLPASLLGMIASGLTFGISANSGSAVGMAVGVALLPAVLLSARRLFAFLSRSEGARIERVVQDVAALVQDSEGGGEKRLP